MYVSVKTYFSPPLITDRQSALYTTHKKIILQSIDYHSNKMTIYVEYFGNIPPVGGFGGADHPGCGHFGGSNAELLG